MATTSLLLFVLDPENVHRLSVQHIRDVEKLQLKNTEYLFGDKSAETHVTTCFLTLGVYNDEENLCGVICLENYPNVPAIPPWEFAHWLHNLYRLDRITSYNTLWIHYSVWHRKYTTMFLKAILQNLFCTYEMLEQVLYVCPPGIVRLDFIEDIATRILPVGHSDAVSVQTIYMLNRTDFVAQYTIRRAVEEDNDDLVAIIPKVLEDTYGHYYISELLNDPEETTRQVIVAEHKGTAVGILCLNETVNYDLLNEEFELVPYHGLKKPDEEDEVMVTPVRVPSPPQLTAITDDDERLPSMLLKEPKEEESTPDIDQDVTSDDEFSLLNISSSLILNYLFEDQLASEQVDNFDVGSLTSIESHFSAVVLNEDYQDHVYNPAFKITARESAGDEGSMEEVKRIRDRKELAVSNPKFFGEPNAFAMEICSAVAEHETCLYLLFQAAFECFPDRDYCVVSFPPASSNHYLMRHFARVVPRPNSVFHHELYVLHKNAILGELAVRVAVPDDVPEVCELICGMIRPTVVEEQFRDSVETYSNQKGYVFTCENQIVGCAVVSEEQEHEFLELNYNIENWVDFPYSRMGSQGCVDELLISPIFQRHVNFFLRDLHRMSDFRIFFYRLKRYDYAYTHRTLPIINALCSLAPVLPNPVPEYDEKIIEEYQLPLCLNKKYQQNFALYLSTPRLTGTPSLEINHRLVIIGAGFTTIAFLESLIFSRNPTARVTFTNVTVISPHGITYHKQPSSLRDMVFVRNGHINRKYTDVLSFRTYVHVVTGVMTSIDRKEKFVRLYDDSFLPYDYLFLLCGEQFQKPPDKLRDNAKQQRKQKAEFPCNVFIVNTEADAGNAFDALKNMVTQDKKGNVVVYGHYLEAICCLAALMEFGMAGSDLIYVDPTPEDGPSNDRHDHLTQFFNNGDVETAVLEEMLNQGITIYQDYNFVEWHVDPDTNRINSVKFESKYKFVDLDLMALFLYHDKGISTRTFQSITRSGLVFNGRVVIDKNFRTNDPYIFAAGPFTMYSKKYHAEHLIHKYYNGEEIGFQLGQEVRRMLIPKDLWDIPQRPSLRRKPIVQYCQFPGKVQYLHVAKPGKPIPMDVAVNKSTYGKLLITGDCKNLDKQGYFRLHLNQYNTIETITCLTKFNLNVQNLICLWGKHESLFNNLLLRYQMKMVGDLYEYFNQPWTCAIYHKSFNKMMDDIDQEFIMTSTVEGKKIVEEVKKMLEFNEWNRLTKLQSDEIEEMCRDSGFVLRIEKKVLDFIHQYYQYLPMYVHQMFIRWILHQIQTSPLFVKTSLILEGDNAARQQSTANPFFRKHKH